MNLNEKCELLRSLHVPGKPLVLPNAWDVASAKVVVEAGFPVVATTSAGVAASLGYEDHEGAPSEEMLAAAGRISAGVEVPVTVDAEAGYGLDATALVAELKRIGVAGCNLEDTDHATGQQREAGEQAAWIAAVHAAAEAEDYPLVINARIDNYIGEFVARLKSGDTSPSSQEHHLPDATDRARRYLDAGATCVYPIALHQPDQIAALVKETDGMINIARMPQAAGVAELADLGIARISFGGGLFMETMRAFAEKVAAVAPAS
ncbi:isocitrate lyase/PEP mutase family protein [Microlunatus parietis]|uniref:2-methylisocitrate lyase-like PEP mutase family enzyme n=1 Tax=Microlunatus parietis TaxID=682979 RepID=A0A7Y9LC68_9ACTN|nr:isocitrate lyase/phosphoenolpyruvate mutase family protein [Microlunatus parietis]NYE70561.1 2-methylisocitrate lyase-like PEP mutase family enzyme [Microlunatus parietis]